ncbi:hypothetical protein EGJ89_14205 [Stenotrophomonas maltophilia]|nr:hypothetical protein EGJ89_14205 [Stenotrophomonas maltophilia]
MCILSRSSAPAFALLLLVPAVALACTSVVSPQSVDGTVEVANADPAGKRLASIPWQGSAFAFRGCSGREPIEIDLAVTGLTYVQDVQMDGLTFAAYETGPTSPLLVFKHNSGYLGGGSNSIALKLGRNVDPNGARPTGEEYRSQVLVYVVSRGGVMTSIPYGLIGSATTWPQSSPSISRTVPISIGVDMKAPACTLSDASVMLDPISADELPAAGSTVGDKPLLAVMRCPGPGISVDLSLADANDPSATGSALQPTVDSDAVGVQIELLHSGVPVQFGQRWSHGLSVGGNEDLEFTARYLRTGSDIAPGDINGQAVLTADYR